VAGYLDAVSPRCDVGPGDVDRAVREAFGALWVPPPDPERTTGRWHRSGGADFERVSKLAQAIE
jgi:hypothetical protein